MATHSIFLPGESPGQRGAWWANSPWSCRVRPYGGDLARMNFGTDMDTDTDLDTGDGAEINTHSKMLI